MPLCYGQVRPGEWIIYHTNKNILPNEISVPSWLMDLCSEPADKEILIKALGRIFGAGRMLGRAEGQKDILQHMKDLLKPVLEEN